MKPPESLAMVDAGALFTGLDGRAGLDLGDPRLGVHHGDRVNQGCVFKVVRSSRAGLVGS
jgi:hypothetical protein